MEKTKSMVTGNKAREKIQEDGLVNAMKRGGNTLFVVNRV